MRAAMVLGADEVAVDGLVQGAAIALQSGPMWDLMCNDPLRHAAIAAAMVAACREGSLANSGAVGSLIMSWIARITPPSRFRTPLVRFLSRIESPSQAVVVYRR